MTEVYTRRFSVKKTSTNNFLQWESYHPTPLKRGIPTGQYLRARRNCSDPIAFKEECDKLYVKFHQRGYPKKVLHHAFTRANATPRESLLQSSINIQSCNEPITRLIGTYDTQNREVI